MTENNSKIGYQFTPMPKQLMHLLDVNLRSMLFALVDISEYFADEDGWFYRSNDQLQMDSCLSKNLVNVTIDTLFNHSLVEVSCIGIGKGKKPNNYKVNMEMFKLFEQLDMNTDIHRPENQIKTLDYKGSGYHPSYLEDDPERFVPELVKGKINWRSTKPTIESTTGGTNVSTEELTVNVTKSEYNIDNIENVYNKENINDIPKDNNILNKKLDNNILLEEKPLVEMDKEKLVRECESSTEPMTKNEEEVKGNSIDTSSKEKSSEATLDSVQDDSQQEGGDDTSSTTQSPLEEAVTGIKMEGLFDPEPCKKEQKKPMLSVRAATRKWAEELETKYQSRERVLQNLASDNQFGFKKYVNYLRLQKKPAFQHHQELIHDLASFWEIDLDLDLD